MRFCIACAALVGVVAAEFTVTDRNVTDGTNTAVEKVLSNTETGENVTLVVNMGGRVESLFLRQPSNGQLYSVLDNNHDNATAMLEPSGFRGLMLIPYANRVANATYVFNNTRYFLPVNEPSRNNSIHGLMYNKTMSVVFNSSDDGQATVTLAHQFGSDPGYPFLLNVAVTYTLSATGLSINVFARNDNKEWPLPFFNSWHPYFNVDDVSRTTVTLDSCTSWNHVDVNPSSLIPTGSSSLWTNFDGGQPIGGNSSSPTPYDDGVKSRSQCEPGSLFHTSISDGNIHAVLWADASFRFMQVFTGAKARFNRSSIAVEPMSGKCDAFNNHDGLHILSGGESFSSSFGIYLR